MVDVSDLEHVVEFMRKHGVTYLKSEGLEVQIGAPAAPTGPRRPALTPEARKAAQVEHQHSVMFAASNVRPRLPEAKPKPEKQAG